MSNVSTADPRPLARELAVELTEQELADVAGNGRSVSGSVTFHPDHSRTFDADAD